MNIVVGTRCLNEQQFIPMFLANHPFASKIVICDGGSTDKSKELATADPRVVWVDFPDKVPGKNGGWRNPEGLHVQATLDMMESLQPDWLWMTEMDAIPNRLLQQEINKILAQMDQDGLTLFQSYLCYLGPDGTTHYPQCMLGPGYTAWKPGLGKVTNLDPFIGQGELKVDSTAIYSVDPPLARLHFTYCSEALIQRKAAFYQQVHDWNYPHPDQYCGPRTALPDWAVWFDSEIGDWVKTYSEGKS